MSQTRGQVAYPEDRWHTQRTGGIPRGQGGIPRGQVAYPDAELALSNDELVKLLASVGLSHLGRHEGMATAVNWDDQLSLGEQQRLAMARLFYHKPRYI